MKKSPGAAYKKARKAGSTDEASRLFQMLSDLGRKTDIWPLPVRIINRRSGWRQKCHGARSWVLVDANNWELVGSPNTVHNVLHAHKLEKAAFVPSACGEFSPEIIDNS